MTPEWFQLVIGPAGALVLAVLFGAGAAKELRKKHAEQIETLRAALARRVEELCQVRAQLEAEHAARLLDAKATTKTLLDLNDRIHRTLDALDSLTRPSGTRTPTRRSTP